MERNPRARHDGFEADWATPAGKLAEGQLLRGKVVARGNDSPVKSLEAVFTDETLPLFGP